MKLQKFRWSKVYESSEEELVGLLQTQGITTQPFEAEAFSTFEETTSVPVTMWCAEGSFGVHWGEEKVSMQPGDGLRIPAQANVTISAGIAGCTWYRK